MKKWKKTEKGEEEALVLCLSKRNQKCSECVRRERESEETNERVALTPLTITHIGGGCVAKESRGWDSSEAVLS